MKKKAKLNEFDYLYDICVVGGCGHVGLPLSLVFANAGIKVCIFDISKMATEKVKNAEMPFMEDGADDILKKVINKTLFVSTSPDVIHQSKFIITVIGTPVDIHLNPSFEMVTNFFDGIIEYLHDGQTVILRSTLYPGSTEKIYNKLIKKYPKIKVSFCPERLAEGFAIRELHTLPQIVSGFDRETLDAVGSLFKLVTQEIIEMSPKEAEVGKLFSNSWRYLQFAIANQFYMIAENDGLNFFNIYRGITNNYPRLSGLPKPGFTAGPCLLKDTLQLSAFSRNSFTLGLDSMQINEGLPLFVIDKIKKETDISKTKVGLLGMSFKAEIDDTRDSLSYKLFKLLSFEAMEVICSDVYVTNDKFVAEDELIKRCDVIIICTPHKKYAGLDYKNKKVIDVWNLLGKL